MTCWSSECPSWSSFGGLPLSPSGPRHRLSKSVAKARIAPGRERRNVDIPRFYSRPIPSRGVFATDLDKPRSGSLQESHPPHPTGALPLRTPTRGDDGPTPRQEGRSMMRVFAGRPRMDRSGWNSSVKVIQWAHGGALLFGPFMCGWTAVVRPSFSRAECASRCPGRGGAGRRGPRDRRVAAEHVT